MHLRFTFIFLIFCFQWLSGQTIYTSDKANILNKKKSTEVIPIGDLINRNFKSQSYEEELKYDPTGMVEKKMHKNGIELYYIDELGNGKFSFSGFDISDDFGIQLNEDCVIFIGDSIEHVLEQMPDLQGTILDNPKRIFIREGVRWKDKVQLTDISLVITFNNDGLVEKISEIQR